MDKLSDYFLNECPIETFKTWFEEANEIEDHPPEAMSLSTITKDGKPRARTVLYKGILPTQDTQGFSFFTNCNSPKIKDIKNNPYVSLVFYWPKYKRQVRIDGKATRSSEEESKNYFYARGRGSQIGSYISTQSEICSSRNDIEKKFKQLEEELKGDTVPFPKNWGGYVVEPYNMEFFLYRENRLNDRFNYALDENNQWNIQRLWP